MLVPAHDEAHSVNEGQGEPGTPGKAPIPDVEHLRSPGVRAAAQEVLFLCPLVTGQLAPGGPPAHSG